MSGSRRCSERQADHSVRNEVSVLIWISCATTHTGVPWYIWACIVAVTSGSVGTIWDISWHKSIGRDSFWTPAHILIYLSGIIAGLSCGYVILAATYGRNSSARGASITMWGFRGPTGSHAYVPGAESP